MIPITVHEPLTFVIQKDDKAVAVAYDLSILEAASFLKRPLQEGEHWLIYSMKTGIAEYLDYQQVIALLFNHKAETAVSDTERLAMIATCMADSVLPQLADLNEAGRFTYPGIIAIVAGWALEFHQQYPTIIERWDQFQTTSLNIYNSMSWPDFVFAWGKAKLAEAARRYGLAS